MVRLRQKPELAIVEYFHGIVDFYEWKGMPCARMWPHWPKRDAHPAEKANQDAFAYVIKSWNLLPEYVKAMYKSMSASTSITGRDIFVRSYLNGNPM